MLPFFWYMLKVIICSGILFGYYWLFLRNKIFHRYNRFYLLASLMLSLLLPLLKINFWQPAADTNQAIRVLQAVSAGDEYMNNIVLTARKSHWSIEQLYPVVYILVSLILFIVMLRTLFLIRTLLKKYPLQHLEDVAFVNTEDDSTPFSFLKYIFWNSSIDIGTKTGRQIFKHEVAHIQEKHSHDKLFVNIILIFCWCNPFFWLYRKELNMIHEFIADKMAVEDSDTAAFASMILQAAYPKQQFDLTNNFFYSPIKRRLLMLTKNKNPRVNYIGRIMVLPLALLIFAAFTFKTKSNTLIYNGKKITVVIDAGHGGRDAGATGADGTLEKDLTLAFAKKIKELNSNDNIEIILVRDADVYMNPTEKVEFAKSKNAALVISLHVDNGPKESANTKTGISVFVARDEFMNAAQSKVLASAIINEFNNNYGIPVAPQLNQLQLTPWILRANTCPAVLIEAGFINNEKDLAYLQTSAAKETIAKNVLAGIEKYFTSPIQLKNVTDTFPLPSKQQWDKATGKASLNNVDTFDYYKKYGGETIYRGQKIKSVFIRSSDNKAVVEFINGKQMIMTQAEAFKEKIIMPPPPPPPPPPGMYPDDKRPVSLQKNGLVVVDGVIQDESYVLDESNILSVNIIKGDKAIAKYGDRGKNGVIEIFKKSTKENSSDLIVERPLLSGKPPSNEPVYPAAIALDKMNVLFIGVDNPMTVAAPGISPEDLQLTISGVGGTIRGSNGKYVARVTTVGTAVISVHKKSDSKLISQSVFRVKRVPDPVNGTLPSDFDAQFKILPGGRQLAETTGKKYPDTISPYKEGNKIFTQTEVSPSFTGGDEAWRKYLRENLKAATPVEEGWNAGIYVITVKFIVHANGTVSDVTTENYPGSKTALHCIDVIKKAPKWQPALQNGRKVDAYKKQPITFVIEE